MNNYNPLYRKHIDDRNIVSPNKMTRGKFYLIKEYVYVDGEKGKFQDEFRVYNQKQCKDCGSDVQKIKIDRTTHYCSTCQPNTLYSLTQ